MYLEAAIIIIITNNTDTILAIEPTDLYKFLGYAQLKGLDHVRIKDILTVVYNKRLNAICKSNSFLIKAVNTYAIPILTYSFGVIKLTKTDAEQLERTTCTTFTKQQFTTKICNRKTYYQKTKWRGRSSRHSAPLGKSSR